MERFLEILPNDPMDIIIGAWIVFVVLAPVGYYVYLRLVKKMKPRRRLSQFLMGLVRKSKEWGR